MGRLLESLRIDPGLIHGQHAHHGDLLAAEFAASQAAGARYVPPNHPNQWAGEFAGGQAGIWANEFAHPPAPSSAWVREFEQEGEGVSGAWASEFKTQVS